ncbi:hypothetical protein FJV41_46080 [Myxococcus llanfairpwllgwyngyllgogerychwyrndrobwllllantysiliogogogochensis]|uniref:Lipoprotein n=1 Tax=Myxococcus llanfairpwllgwyngyllgogerychwyrndrobwllllantysiliogogogochensis TaxID=2590453 RepID=A0A540WL41_9BACT|nr:hypothetical protein [Myxococcus llanfairpwllgwyngyllgogerychwyrndrobwllllantysiliogogogochensis]TQF09154.1 hypothetical protein FJV41_46080 [Myxococcus llanfairpwllgwyngyllgogerychwyrndrobwllllantysiliogogogochensis]
MNRLPALFLALALSGCATVSKKSDLEELKPTVDKFHQLIRWKDFRSASRLLVPERRAAFSRARVELHDERDLSITDYEIEEVRLAEDGAHATVQSRIQWMRLPSASENTAVVLSEFVFRDGVWLLERQDAGPFVDELKGALP